MTASKFLKRLHAKAVRGNRFISLKQFVRELATTGNEEEKTAVASWKLNKGPTQRQLDKQDRYKRKGGIIELQRKATKAAKRKSSNKQPGK